ncbi:uncharacterized protein KIAA0825-like [Amphiura filiformis]|uniref:uncharacterized protein KIAA0825-like n=1 Tax=Amphiura filiformis TaxID=82378 RepID=UPI003B215DF7
MADEVPCLPNMMALFENGVPSLETLQYAIGDIDQQLTENDRSIEKVLQELVKATNGLSADNNYTNIKDAMDSLIHTPVLEECACLPPEPDDVNKLLKAILHHLTSSPGSENAIFDQLLCLASHEGLGLPIRAPKPDLVGDSNFSLNSISDSKEQENDLVWEDIRSRLKRHFLECLQSMPTTSKSESKIIQTRRVEYLQSLCILFPELEVWNSYQQVRSQQLINTVRTQLGGAQGGGDKNDSKSEMHTPSINTPPKLSLCDLAGHMQQLVSVIQLMVKEDGDLFLTDVFNGRVDFMQCIQDLYMQTLSEELQPVISDTVTTVVGRDDAGCNGKKKEEVGNNFHSHVADDRLFDTAVESAKVELNPEDLTAFITIVTGLAALDSYMRHLFDQVTRDFAPPIVPRKPRSTIKSVLKNSPRDSLDRDGKGRGGDRDYNSQKGIMSDAIPPPFGVTPCMMQSANSNKTHIRQSVLDSPSKKLHWNWIDLLERLVPDVTWSVTKLILDTLQTSLHQEEEVFQKSRCTNEVPVCRDLVNGSLDYPKLISVSLAELVSALENLMPLAVLASEGVMKAIRTAFTDAIEANLTQIFITLSNRLKTFESTSAEDGDSEVYTGITEVYKMLSAAVFCTSYLTHIKSILTDDDTRRSLSGVHKQLTEFSNAIVDITKNYHSGVISSSILHDAESNNWADQRAFFEDERVSFSIQMWNLHMKGLQQELFASCPPRHAQRILALVLRDSLKVLSQRYSRAMPSYKRTKQLRSDITAILLTTLDFLWSSANSVQAVLDQQVTVQPYSDIHNCCICLLSTMAVVASPLQDFYKVFKKGFQHKRMVLKDAEKEGVPMVIPWMVWTRMEVFYGCEKGFEGVQKRSAVFILLKLLSSQPSPNYAMILQALLVRDNLLPVLLVRNADQKMCQSSQESLSSTSPNTSGCGGICCPGQQCYSNQSCEIPDIIQPIVDVLILCTDHPNALANVLIAMIEKDDDMSIFEPNCIPGKTVPVPPWLACVYELLSFYIDGAIKASIGHLTTVELHKEVSVGFLDSLRELPCGCVPKKSRNMSNQTESKDIPNAVLQTLIKRVTNDVVTIPMPLCVFFETLRQNLCTKKIRSAHNTPGIQVCITIPMPLCVFFETLRQNLCTKKIRSAHNTPGIQIIASCLYNKLHDVEGLAELVGHPLEASTLASLATTADYCHQILTCEDAGGLEGKSQEAVVFIKRNSEWLEKNMNKMIGHLSNELLDDYTAYPLEDSPYEFVSHFMTELAETVCQNPEGQKSLLQVYHILKNNMDWLAYHLEIPPSIPNQQDTPTIPHFSLDVPPPLSSNNDFSPLASFNRLGESPFNHDALAEFAIDWLKLLQSDMGLSEAGFRNLLLHRHEMQEDAYLEEIEKKPVRVLRLKYDLDNDDLV